jgi:hypothetical protein
MKIIITESQYQLILEWWKRNESILNDILSRILERPTNWYKEILFGTEDEFIDKVIERLHNDWAYKKMSFSGESVVKELLKDRYSKMLIKYYNKHKR